MKFIDLKETHLAIMDLALNGGTSAKLKDITQAIAHRVDNTFYLDELLLNKYLECNTTDKGMRITIPLKVALAYKRFRNEN